MTTPPASADAPVCPHCKATYSPDDPKEVERHTTPVYCEGCRRCDGRPTCYMCTGSFCMCPNH